MADGGAVLAYRDQTVIGPARAESLCFGLLAARHPGGPVTHLLPHHRYVCTRHRYWVGPPDIAQPATGLGGLDDIVRAQRHHLRLLGRHGPAAAYDAVLTGFLFCGHLWADRREDG
ncbi:MAG: hypothetical protein JWR37_68, partial [Mycobacterium sp.]|nr:hypothetical protein [Mycobacterium sp.]